MLININKNFKLIEGNNIFSFKEISENINNISSILNIRNNEYVGIFCENRPEWVFSFFAVWKNGGINVPIDFMSSSEEVAYILKDASIRTVICSEKTVKILEEAEKLIKKSIKKINLDSLYYLKKEEKEPIEKNIEDTAVVLYTSGTTGNPKGVLLSYKNLLSNINGISKAKIATEKDITVAILPFHHSYPLMVTMLVPASIGATVVFIPELSPESIINTMKKHRITILIGVPKLYELFHRKIFSEINRRKTAKTLFWILKKVKNQKISKIIFKKVHETFGGNIRYFVSGGAKLDEEIAKDLWTLGFKIIEGYGLTETSPIVSFNPPNRIKLGSVGKPIEGVTVKIEKGEILVKGDNVMKGYLNKEEETKRVLKDGWLYTGDLGKIDEEGYIYITGRKKEIIVLPNGKNINPEEIESKILKISNIIKEVAVIERNGNLFAIVYPDFPLIEEKGILNIEETVKWWIIDRYNRTVPDYKKIYGFKIVKTELPKTRLGKIKRYLLKDFLEEKESTKKEEPKTQEYRLIKQYLEKITKKPVYPHYHIEIDVGLDSLEKVEFLTFLEEAFGIKITEEQLSKFENIAEISSFIEKQREKIQEKAVNWKSILLKPKVISVEDKKIPILVLKRFLKPVFLIYNRVEVQGLENLPKNRPFILAPNHQSYLDGFLIISFLPDEILKNTYFLAEETFFESSFRKFIADNFRILTVNINKNLKDSLQKVAFILKRGKNVVIFPEGARTRDGNLLPFKKSFAILSKELDIPVVPVVIKGAYQSLPIDKKVPKPVKIHIHFLKPIFPDKKDYEEIKNQVFNSIKDELEKIVL